MCLDVNIKLNRLNVEEKTPNMGSHTEHILCKTVILCW